MTRTAVPRMALACKLGLAVLLVGCSEQAPTEAGTPPILVAPGGGVGGPQVDATDPTSAPQNTTLEVRVLGQNFASGAKVDFLLHGLKTPGVRTNSTRFVSATEVVANITIAADAVVDLYDVQVTLAGKKPGVGIELFAVLQQGPPGQWDPPPLVITFGQGSTGTDALRGDDVANSSYPTPGHISVNGNLMFWLGSDNPRSVRVTTSAFDGQTRDRIFTNNHTNPGGDDSFGLLGMVEGSTGSAVVEAELNVQDNDPYVVLRYGKDCSGNVVSGAKAVTTRSTDGRTWTITGSNGVHCQKLGKKPALSQVGTAGPFSMTLVWP